jgi:hypothetical protein
MENDKNVKLLHLLARIVLALGTLLGGDNFILIGGRKVGKRGFLNLNRQLAVLAHEMGILEKDPVKEILDEAIKVLNDNNNHSGAKLLEKFMEGKFSNGENDNKV